MKRYILLSLCASFALANVNITSKDNKKIMMTITTEFVMGDNDTITMSEDLALLNAKKEAIEVAGTHIESKYEREAHSSGDTKSSYSLKTLASAITSCTKASKQINGRTLTLTAQCTADTSPLETTVNNQEIIKDLALSKQINDSLLRQLDVAREALKNANNKKEALVIQNQQLKLLTQIHQNDKTQTIFLNGVDGEVLVEKAKAQKLSEELYNQEKLYYTKKVSEYFKQKFNEQVKFEVSEPKLTLLKSGMYHVEFTYSTKIDRDRYMYQNSPWNDAKLLELDLMPPHCQDIVITHSDDIYGTSAYWQKRKDERILRAKNELKELEGSFLGLFVNDHYINNLKNTIASQHSEMIIYPKNATDEQKKAIDEQWDYWTQIKYSPRNCWGNKEDIEKIYQHEYKLFWTLEFGNFSTVPSEAILIMEAENHSTSKTNNRSTKVYHQYKQKIAFIINEELAKKLNSAKLVPTIMEY